MLGSPNITVRFFGDGATSTGPFHESVNLASVWQHPALFPPRQQLFAMSTPLRKQANIADLALRGQAYGIKSVSMDGNDAVGIYLAAREAREYVRENGQCFSCSTPTGGWAFQERRERLPHEAGDQE